LIFPSNFLHIQGSRSNESETRAENMYDTEDGGSAFFRKFSKRLLDYKASHRTLHGHRFENSEPTNNIDSSCLRLVLYSCGRNKYYVYLWVLGI
jgi:hypothetical protein